MSSFDAGFFFAWALYLLVIVERLPEIGRRVQDIVAACVLSFLFLTIWLDLPEMMWGALS